MCPTKSAQQDGSASKQSQSPMVFGLNTFSSNRAVVEQSDQLHAERGLSILFPLIWWDLDPSHSLMIPFFYHFFHHQSRSTTRERYGATACSHVGFWCDMVFRIRFPDGGSNAHKRSSHQCPSRGNIDRSLLPVPKSTDTHRKT
jgi:hypothetical protein